MRESRNKDVWRNGRALREIEEKTARKRACFKGSSPFIVQGARSQGIGRY